jgi:hypothetical protein
MLVDAQRKEDMDAREGIKRLSVRRCPDEGRECEESHCRPTVNSISTQL